MVQNTTNTTDIKRKQSEIGGESPLKEETTTEDINELKKKDTIITDAKLKKKKEKDLNKFPSEVAFSWRDYVPSHDLGFTKTHTLFGAGDS